MTRRLISSGSPYEAQIGYSRAVVDGEWIFVSGTTGFDYASMRHPRGRGPRRPSSAGATSSARWPTPARRSPTSRVHYIVPTRGFHAAMPVLAKVMGPVRPAATMICAGLLDERMRIEIEVTARVRAAA